MKRVITDSPKVTTSDRVIMPEGIVISGLITISMASGSTKTPIVIVVIAFFRGNRTWLTPPRCKRAITAITIETLGDYKAKNDRDHPKITI